MDRQSYSLYMKSNYFQPCIGQICLIPGDREGPCSYNSLTWGRIKTKDLIGRFEVYYLRSSYLRSSFNVVPGKSEAAPVQIGQRWEQFVIVLQISSEAGIEKDGCSAMQFSYLILQEIIVLRGPFNVFIYGPRSCAPWGVLPLLAAAISTRPKCVKWAIQYSNSSE